MRARRLAPLVLAALAWPWAGGAAWGGIRDSAELNYEIQVPDDWTWIDASPWEKDYAVVQAARRQLDRLADGKPAEGQGGLALLSVGDPPKSFPAEEFEGWLYEWQRLEAAAKEKESVPEDVAKRSDELLAKIEKALADLAGQAEVQRLLLSRFGKDPARWPAAEVDARGNPMGTIPSAAATAEGSCANLAGVVSPCHASMHVWLLRKRMYRLAVWIWPTPRDREHLRDQRDFIEGSTNNPKPEAIPPKPPKPGPDAPGANGGGPAAAPPKGERETVRDLAMGFEVVRPARLAAKAIDRAEPSDRDTAFRFQADERGDSVLVEMFAFRIGTAGATAFDLREYFAGMWASFLKGHPAGPISTSPFPPATPRNPLLTLPDLAKKKDVQRPEDPKDKPSLSDLEKLGVAQEVKNAGVGKTKVEHAWRMDLKGNVERTGDEWWVVYTFSTPARTYVVRVTVRKGGWATFKDDVSEVLRSIALIEEK